MFNTILNLLGWMPIYALLIAGVYGYIKLAVRFITRR